MKISKIFAVVTAMAAMMSMASCSDDKKTSEGTGENSIIRYDKPTEAPTAAPTEAVEVASDGPRLSIKDTTVKAGEVAEVTIAIENAEAAWNMCGFHITYPEELIPEMMDAEERLVRKKMGEASEYNAGSVAMEWVDNKTEYLITNKLGSIFFTEIFDSDYGLNGDVVTFYLKVPEDAASGTEYPVDFMYIDGDVFSNVAGDKAMEKYVFENWKGGKIIVE
jgi:hypothetical protein